jgi:hypothetical protein
MGVPRYHPDVDEAELSAEPQARDLNAYRVEFDYEPEPVVPAMRYEPSAGTMPRLNELTGVSFDTAECTITAEEYRRRCPA